MDQNFYRSKLNLFNEEALDEVFSLDDVNYLLNCIAEEAREQERDLMLVI